ncbi:tyrosine-protein phosphatase [Tsukamurella soli]|uniref:tyrosine-protein phosphatase n=1 Tax=Tsukamurella soli TaxID=644556 RepID=UPI00360BC915
MLHTRIRRVTAAAVTVAMLALGGGATATAAPAPGTVDSASALALHTPRLQGADNFRDVAGTVGAYPTAGGGHLRPGVDYRSNALILTPADQATVTRLGITTDIDLRTASEIAAAPDRLPAGVKYVNIDILGRSAFGTDQEKAFASVTSPDAAREVMRKLNISFVDDAYERAQYKRVLLTVLNAPGPVVFHCTSGKDRTGWTSAILQLTAGVSHADVMRDYLATNRYSARSITAATTAIAAKKGRGPRRSITWCSA